MKHVCPICGNVYDSEKEGKPFSELPDSWVCPLCGAPKSSFVTENTAKTTEAKVKPLHLDDDMKKLSAGEFAALCSNLARGCEKQYKDEEASLFRKIADYFTAATPSVPDASMEKLANLIQSDLSEGYPALRSSAIENSDRGTQRICVWGEKVTNILNSLLQRWEKEGDNFVKNTEIWVCTVCGFVFVGDSALQLCPVCKVPSWKFEKIEGRKSK